MSSVGVARLEVKGALVPGETVVPFSLTILQYGTLPRRAINIRRWRTLLASL